MVVPLLVVVVSGEGVEGAERHPSCAEFGAAVLHKAANIRSNERNAVHVEIENLGDRPLHVAPIGRVVAGPLMVKRGNIHVRRNDQHQRKSSLKARIFARGPSFSRPCLWPLPPKNRLGCGSPILLCSQCV